MPVNLYDTLTSKYRLLLPSNGNLFRLYCCGPTVYGPVHVGNFRTFIIQDVLRRVLEVDFSIENKKKIEFKHVRNITDVDDKTIQQSISEGKTLKDFTSFWTRKFHSDCTALNLLLPHVEPIATEHIREQVAMIDKLLKTDNAYIGKDGSVYFNISAYPHYGILNNHEIRRDFVLWKVYKDTDGPNYWIGPLNPKTNKPIIGRPAWHIECSAMCLRYLGTGIDLHSGGIDLCFPHHENEIAQSESATEKIPFCHHWFHSAHLMIRGKKMSRSLGNLYTLDYLRKKGHTPASIRYYLLSSHYRKNLNFTEYCLIASAKALMKLEKSIISLLKYINMSKEEFRSNIVRPNTNINGFTDIFVFTWKYLCNDLNVPAALGKVFTTLKGVSLDKNPSKSTVTNIVHEIGSIIYALGLDVFNDTRVKIPTTQVNKLADLRSIAKQSGDFVTADFLRYKISTLGWTIRDNKKGFNLLQTLKKDEDQDTKR